MRELDSLDGVFPGCTLAVAETGTLVLDGSAEQGRRVTTRIPDYHLCVELAHQVVAGRAAGRARPGTDPAHHDGHGPSATSDIELNRVEGVHGPRILEVFVVER